MEIRRSATTKTENRGERSGHPPDANGESGALAGESGTEEPYEYDSPRGDGSTVSAGGRAMVMLRVTVAAAGGSLAAAGVEEEDHDEKEEEKDEYLRSLPRPESGRGPATVSSQSWSRRPIQHPARMRSALSTWLRLGACGECAVVVDSR
jgi:hypothetical protein